MLFAILLVGEVKIFEGVGGSGQKICRCVWKWPDHLQEWVVLIKVSVGVSGGHQFSVGVVSVFVGQGGSVFECLGGSG